MANEFWVYTCYGGWGRVLLVAIGFLISLVVLLGGLLVRNPTRQGNLSETGMLFSYVFLVLGVASCGFNCLEMYDAIKTGIMRADVPVVRIASGLYVYATCSLILSLVSIFIRLFQRTGGKGGALVGVQETQTPNPKPLQPAPEGKDTGDNKE